MSYFRSGMYARDKQIREMQHDNTVREEEVEEEIDRLKNENKKLKKENKKLKEELKVLKD